MRERDADMAGMLDRREGVETRKEIVRHGALPLWWRTGAEAEGGKRCLEPINGAG
jgi:hypothetical protein